MATEFSPVPYDLRQDMSECPICQWALQEADCDSSRNRFQQYFASTDIPQQFQLPFYELIVLRGKQTGPLIDNYQFLTGEKGFCQEANKICEIYSVSQTDSTMLQGMVNQFVNEWLQARASGN